MPTSPFSLNRPTVISDPPSDQPSAAELSASSNGHNSIATVTATHRDDPARTKSMTAAASVLTDTKIKRMKVHSPVTGADWQKAAWHFFDITGELAYITRFEADAMSRAVLTAARKPDTAEGQPVTIDDDDHPANIAMSAFLGGRVNQAQDIGRIDTQLTVSGVSYVAMWEEGKHQRWAVLSNDEINRQGKTWRMTVDGEDVVVATDKTLVVRIWDPHPRTRWEPNSPVRHLIPVLAELEGLTKHVSATIDSRLAGAGILGLPSELSFESTADDVPEGVDEFTWELVQNMTTPITDRDVASAVVPMVVRGAAEHISKITHLEFNSPLDPQIKELRVEAIRRIALGLDTPPEILLGLAEANHWTSWQIEESSIKLHIEPKLQRICHAATVGYLRPYLRAMDVPNPDDYVCWYDVTQIKLRPNRSSDAKDLHDDILISDRARLEAAGFDQADRPSDTEFRDQLLRKVITDAPQLGLHLLPLVGITPVNLTTGNETDDIPDVNNNPEQPDDDPTPDTAEDDGTVDASEVEDGTDGR